MHGYELQAGPLRLVAGAFAWSIYLGTPDPTWRGATYEVELATGIVELHPQPGDAQRAAEDAARALVLAWFGAFDPDGAALAALDAGVR